MLYLINITRLVIGIIFLYSFASKLRNVAAFEKSIQNFQLLPASLHRLTSTVVILGEIAIVLMMALGGRWLFGGYSLSILMLVIFIYALKSVLRRHIQTTCNCFGSTEQVVSTYDVWRNIAIILAAMIGLVSLLLNTTQGSPSILDWLLSGMVAIAISVLLLNLREILKLVV